MEHYTNPGNSNMQNQTNCKPRRAPRETEIIVNTRERIVDERFIDFDEVINLAYENPPTGEFICFTVVYERGPRQNKSGILTNGERVCVKKGMIFDVTYTDKS